MSLAVGRRPKEPLGLLALAVVVACVLFPTAGHGQAFSPYSDFLAMTPSQLATLQVKLTWLGFQTQRVPTVALTAVGNGPNPSLFAPFERPGFDYSNDDSQIDSLTATVAALDAMLDSVATVPGVTDGGVDAGGYLSFALLNTAGGTKAFESILDTTNAIALLGRMQGALAASPAAVRGLRELACGLRLLLAAPPTDVTSRISVAFSGIRLVRNTGEMVGTMKITNISGTSIAGPLTVVVVTTELVELVGEVGRTCRIQPAGRPYLILSVGTGLAPGAMVQTGIRFSNPDLDAITPQVFVFSGQGSR
jgi:hypothetical protein